MGDNRIDEETGVETTGHEWDGIEELNNPLPRWWLIVFWVTVIWAGAYMVLMPAWPGLTDYTKGIRNHSERANVAIAMEQLKDDRAAFVQQITEAENLSAIQQDPELLQFAMAAGASAFGDNCATCHGSGGQGFIGYPNLNDDAWIWGGTLEDISQTLHVGIRSGHPEARWSEMPAFGRDGILTEGQINEVTEYVLQISGRDADQAAAERGEVLFEENCSACHMPGGIGLRDLGAPNLTDADWLYGGDRTAIYESIYNSRYGVMPAWSGRLDEATIASLSVYVHSLGGGE